MANDTKNDAQFENLDALFAASLDDIADLPTFEVPPEGTYIGTVSCALKEINKKQAIEAEFTLIEVSELEEELEDGAKGPQAGDKFSIAFILGSNIAEGKLKQFLAPFGAHFGTNSVGELVRDRIKDVQVAFTLKHRTNKKGDDPDRIYPDVRNVTVA